MIIEAHGAVGVSHLRSLVLRNLARMFGRTKGSSPFVCDSLMTRSSRKGSVGAIRPSP